MALLALTLWRPAAPPAQTVQRDQINGFWAVLSADSREPRKLLNPTTFEQWGIDFDTRPTQQSLVQEGAAYRWVVAYDPSSAPLLEVPLHNVAVMPLQQLPHFERQSHVLSFWRARGDSLVFWFLDRAVHDGFMGRLRIGQHTTLANGTLLIATESVGWDAGERVGRYEFLGCDLTRCLVNSLYSCSFASDLCSPSDTLRYELRRTDERIITLVLFRTRLDSRPDPEAPLGCRRVVVGHDTTYVDLSEAAGRK